MAINFTIPNTKLSKKAQEIIGKGFGLPIVSSLVPSIPDYPVGDLPEGYTKFGTPYYGSLFIEKPNYGVPEYDEQTKTYSTAAVSLADNYSIGDVTGCLIEHCIVDINEPNNVVTTSIAGQNGTIKEYINKGDTSITIRGFFEGSIDKYPTTDTRLLRSYCIAPVSLKITNTFLNEICGVTKLVVVSSNFAQQQGMRNIQYFQIDAISDTDYTIEELSK